MKYFSDMSDLVDSDFFWAYMDMREGHYLCPIGTRDLLYMFCGYPL